MKSTMGIYNGSLQRGQGILDQCESTMGVCNGSLQWECTMGVCNVTLRWDCTMGVSMGPGERTLYLDQYSPVLEELHPDGKKTFNNGFELNCIHGDSLSWTD